MDEHGSMPVDWNGLEVLSREECLRLVAGAHVGRVAVTVDALPAVFPVNFVLDDEAIVFRTAAGTKLDAATANAVIAFEVDSADPLYHTGWSVLVQGVASEIVEPGELERAWALPLRAWAGHDRDRFVRISTDRVSGRRLVQPPLATEIPGQTETRR
jgi:uncharacterized protein